MLYKVQKQDIKQVVKVLADAFQHDPVWNKFFERDPDIEKRFRVFFETPVRYCLKYGEVYAPSENLEGVIAWLPGKNADMKAWSMIRSGAVISAMKIGLKAGKMMGTAFKQVIEDRHKNMAGCNYLYIQVFGVATGLQGKGFGRKLIDAAIKKCESEGLQLYLETETEENVKMYEHFGFRLIRKITLPILELPMWEMVKENRFFETDS